MGYYGWKPYVPVAKRRARAEREMRKLAGEGRAVEPIAIQGRKIARTFWGEAWCEHLERFSDYANRLPRGRTYVRNGSVFHLGIGTGRIEALVSGSELYTIEIRIDALPAPIWERVRAQCSGKIGSVLELLRGQLSNAVMQVVTHRDQGLFPNPGEIHMGCSCPDWAGLCKHLAAVLYGVGARLDERPELLFQLRGVDPRDLIGTDLDLTRAADAAGKRRRLADEDLSGLFGVEIEEQAGTRRPARPCAAGPAAEGSTGTRAAKATRAEVSKAKAEAMGKGEDKADGKGTSAGDGFTPSGPAVVALRRRLGLNKSELARLLGVSAPCITNWEAKTGPLNLRTSSLQALCSVAGLTAEQAVAMLRRRKGRV